MSFLTSLQNELPHWLPTRLHKDCRVRHIRRICRIILGNLECGRG